MNTADNNTNGSAIWQMVHHDLLLVGDFEDLLPSVPKGTHRMIVCHNEPQRIECILNVSWVLTPMQLVAYGEENQYILNQFASLESYCTRWPGYVDLNRDACCPDPSLISVAFCTV